MRQLYLKNVATLDFDRQKCIGCTMCWQVCPHHVFRIEGRKAQIQNRDGCMECGACARNCPAGAISVRSGVGCAAAIINGKRRGTAPSCDCSEGENGSPCCS